MSRGQAFYYLSRVLDSLSTAWNTISTVGQTSSNHRHLQLQWNDDDNTLTPPDEAGAINRSTGILLILVASVSWGAYGGVRKHFAPNAENVPFMVNQQLAQFLFAILVVIPQWNSIQTNFAMDKFLFVFFAGMTTLLAEFLYLASTKHLSSTAAMACFALPSDCFVSIIIDQCIQSYGVKLKYLIVAASLYLIGEGFFILVDYTYEKEAWRHYDTWIIPTTITSTTTVLGDTSLEKNNTSTSDGDNIEPHNSRVTLQPVSNTTTTTVAIAGLDKKMSTSGDDSYQQQQSDLVPSSSSSNREEEGLEPLLGTSGSASGTKKPLNGWYVFFWVTVALFGGISLGLFTILSSIGMTGEGAITDPGTALIIMQTGQTLGLPIIIFFFGYWDPFSMLPANERMTMDTRLSNLFNLTQKDATIAYLVGLFISGGYACFYYGTEGVPFAVADGLLSAETLVTFILSAFVFDEYKGTELFSPVFTFLLLGCIFYIYAVVVLSVLSF